MGAVKRKEKNKEVGMIRKHMTEIDFCSDIELCQCLQQVDHTFVSDLASELQH